MMDQRSKHLESSLTITVGLLVFFIWLKKPWLLYGALGVGAAGLFSPWLAQKIYQGWWMLARGMGWLNGKILLSLVFFVILVPLAWIARRLNAIDLQLRKKDADESYYTVRDHQYESNDLENTW
jgi:hypothetical protein